MLGRPCCPPLPWLLLPESDFLGPLSLWVWALVQCCCCLRNGLARTDVRTCLLILVWLINHRQPPPPTGIKCSSLLLSHSLSYRGRQGVELPAQWGQRVCGFQDTWARVTNLGAGGLQGREPRSLSWLGWQVPTGRGAVASPGGARKERGAGRRGEGPAPPSPNPYQ